MGRGERQRVAGPTLTGVGGQAQVGLDGDGGGHGGSEEREPEEGGAVQGGGGGGRAAEGVRRGERGSREGPRSEEWRGPQRLKKA